jgi:hypothetical protein
VDVDPFHGVVSQMSIGRLGTIVQPFNEQLKDRRIYSRKGDLGSVEIVRSSEAFVLEG